MNQRLFRCLNQLNFSLNLPSASQFAASNNSETLVKNRETGRLTTNNISPKI